MELKLFEIESTVEHININKIVEVLNSTDRKAIKDWAYILHNKDIGVTPHYHVCVRLKSGYDTKYIAEWFGVTENRIERCKSDWAHMLQYLVHNTPNSKEKYQYEPSEVIANFDWQSVKSKEKDIRKSEIIQNIVNGNYREYNITEFVNAIEYCKYKRDIDNTFTYRAEQLKSKGVERDMNCYFITGSSGTGKTTYAKQLAKDLNYSIFISSGSNDILDGYRGEDCIILDDLRPSCLGLSDLLKMLDNNTSSSVKSRYKNKVLECKLIIVTTILPLDSFFNQVFSEQKEPLEQLKRRFAMHFNMTVDYMFIKTYDKKKQSFGREYKYPNPVQLEYQSEELTTQQEMEKMQKMVGTTLNVMKDIIVDTVKDAFSKDKKQTVGDKQIELEDEGKKDLPW